MILDKETLNTICKRMFTCACIDLNISHKKNFADFLFDIVSTHLSAHQIEFLNQYEGLIQQKTRGAIRDKSYHGDVKNFLRLEILKAYKFKYKYNDWHYVVKSVINRRLSDYTKKIYRYNRNVFSDGLFNSECDYLNFYDDNAGVDTDEMNRICTRDLIHTIRDKITANKNRYFHIQIVYFDTMFTLHQYGFDPMNYGLIYEAMGYQEGNEEHKKEFTRIQNKSKKIVREIYADIT